MPPIFRVGLLPTSFKPAQNPLGLERWLVSEEYLFLLWKIKIRSPNKRILHQHNKSDQAKLESERTGIFEQSTPGKALGLAL